MQPELNWSEAYRSGRYRLCWDFADASPELVAFTAANQLRAGAFALDVGCGSGQDAAFLATLGYRVWGLDICAEALRLARITAEDRGVDVSWLQGNALDLPFNDGQFDFVNDRGCFHHFRDADCGAYAQEVGRILRSGGLLFLRGCARNQVPFNPVTAESLSLTFGSDIFAIESIRPIRLVVDSGNLDGTVAVVRRR